MRTPDSHWGVRYCARSVTVGAKPTANDRTNRKDAKSAIPLWRKEPFPVPHIECVGTER